MNEIGTFLEVVNRGSCSSSSSVVCSGRSCSGGVKGRTEFDATMLKVHSDLQM